MNIQFLRKTSVTRRFFYALAQKRAEDVVRKIKPYLVRGETVLELGSGTCNVAEILLRKGFNVKLVDVKDQSFVPDLQPILYDGINLPFANDTFDTASLLDVLHHTMRPEQVLKEAKRVARRLVIMESIYCHRPEKVLFLIVDSILNLEFAGHPRNYRKDEEWRNLFTELGLHITSVDYTGFWWVFRCATYLLEKRGDSCSNRPSPNEIQMSSGTQCCL